MWYYCGLKELIVQIKLSFSKYILYRKSIYKYQNGKMFLINVKECALKITKVCILYVDKNMLSGNKTWKHLEFDNLGNINLEFVKFKKTLQTWNFVQKM